MPEIASSPKTASLEKLLIQGFLQSESFLSRIQDLWPTEGAKGPLEAVAMHALDFYRTYGQPPGVQVSLQIEEDKALRDADREIALRIVSSLSESGSVNADVLFDRAVKYLRRRHIEKKMNIAQAALARDDVDAAGSELTDFSLPTPVTSNFIDPYNDDRGWLEAFTNRVDPVIHLPGALGNMMAPAFERGGFVAFLGSFGSGKSWWLLDLALRCHVRERKNVVYITVGDLNAAQVRRRMGIRAAKKSDLRKFCGELLIPVIDCERNQKGECVLDCRTSKVSLDIEGIPTRDDFYKAPADYKPCRACNRCKPCVWYRLRPSVKPLTGPEALAAWKMHESWTTGCCFRILEYASDTLSPNGIDRELDNLEKTEGIVPDVLVVDYADLLTSDAKDREERVRIDHVWKNLRRITQERHVLGITATQADTEAMDVRILRPRNFSGTRTKLDHVTAFFGLNSSDEDVRRGVQRVNALKQREDECIVTDCCTVLRSIQTGQPILDSY